MLIARFSFDNCGNTTSAQRISEYIKSRRSYQLSGSATEEREFRPLMEIPDNHPKLVLSMDRNWGDGREGIRRKYLPDFLPEGTRSVPA